MPTKATRWEKAINCGSGFMCHKWENAGDSTFQMLAHTWHLSIFIYFFTWLRMRAEANSSSYIDWQMDFPPRIHTCAPTLHSHVLTHVCLLMAAHLTSLHTHWMSFGARIHSHQSFPNQILTFSFKRCITLRRSLTEVLFKKSVCLIVSINLDPGC
jgi:hypothetical protein